MLRDQPRQLLDQLGTTTELQLRIHTLLDRGHIALAQLPDLRLGELLERQVLERPPPPQPERGAQQPSAILDFREMSLTHQPVEAREIEPLRIDPQHIPRRLQLDQLRPEELPQCRNLYVQRRRRRARTGRTP